MNPLYKDVRGKVISDFYSEYDINMLGVSMDELSSHPTSEYEKACALYYDAQTLGDDELMAAALTLIESMQDAGYGRE